MPWLTARDNPELWSNMPVALQLVARPFDDERLMGATAALDAVINA